MYVISITLTWALTWLLKWVSATCWGSFNWQKQLIAWDNKGILILKPYFTGDHSQTTSNGATRDACVHKCFSLGLSWLWQVLLLKFITSPFTIIPLARGTLTLELCHTSNVVMTITLIYALTLFFNAVSASRWGSFLTFTSPVTNAVSENNEPGTSSFCTHTQKKVVESALKLVCDSMQNEFYSNWMLQSTRRH